MSALTPKADILCGGLYVRFVPIADMADYSITSVGAREQRRRPRVGRASRPAAARCGCMAGVP